MSKLIVEKIKKLKDERVGMVDRMMNVITFHPPNSTAYAELNLRIKVQELVIATLESLLPEEILYCDDCENLYPKEHEQSFAKDDHICNLYHRVILHHGCHPRFPRPNGCEHYKKEEK